MDSLVEITTTVGSSADAQMLAHLLVVQKLAACVQIVGPLTSVYRWQGEVQEEMEWRCTIKTRQGILDDVMNAIRAEHPYTVPEILVIPVIRAHPEYEAWLRESTGAGERE